MNLGRSSTHVSQAAILVFAGWFLVALFVGETRLLAALPPFAPQAILWTLTAVLLGLLWKSESARQWAWAVPLQALVALHLVRFIGFYFLYLHHLGELPSVFAVPAGWGDIAVAVGALVLLRLRDSKNWRTLLAIWNTLALADILFVVTSGVRLAPDDRLLLMEQLTSLPLSFLPTLLVPLIIASHLLIFARLLKPAGARIEPAPDPVDSTAPAANRTAAGTIR